MTFLIADLQSADRSSGVKAVCVCVAVCLSGGWILR